MIISETSAYLPRLAWGAMTLGLRSDCCSHLSVILFGEITHSCSEEVCVAAVDPCGTEITIGRTLSAFPFLPLVSSGTPTHILFLFPELFPSTNTHLSLLAERPRVANDCVVCRISDELLTHVAGFMACVEGRGLAALPLACRCFLHRRTCRPQQQLWGRVCTFDIALS